MTKVRPHMATARAPRDPKYPIALRISIREAQLLHSMILYVAERVHDVEIPEADRESFRDVAAQLDTELEYQWRRRQRP